MSEIEAAAIAGWNACRKSIYAVCEDVQDEYEKHRQDTDSVNRHHFGRGGMTAAKSIARGFGAMGAKDDNHFREALAALLSDSTDQHVSGVLGDQIILELKAAQHVLGYPEALGKAVESIAWIEQERVRLWNEVRDLKASLNVEAAATDAMRIERDEAVNAIRDGDGEVTDEMVERAWTAYDHLSGYSKPERFRAALVAALGGAK